MKRVGNRFLWAFARKLPLSWMAMPLKKVVTWRDTPLTRGEQLTLMFNILFMRTVSAAGTAFREASFSWRCGHFLLSHYLFFVLFHSVCSHYTFIGNAVFWPGLSILQSSAFPFSLLIISCSSPSCSFVFLRAPCPARVFPIRFGPSPHPRPALLIVARNAMRGEPIGQHSIRGIAERYDSRVAASGGDRERITYAIVDYHRAVDDVSAGNTVQAAFTVGPVFLPGLSILHFRHIFSTCPRSLALQFCSRCSSAELPSNISPMIIINHVTLPRSRRRASHGAAATSSFHINLSSFVNSRVSFLSARTTCSLATRSFGPAFQFFSQSFPHFSLFFSVSFKLLLSINLGDYDSRILACNLQQRNH